MTRLEHEPKVQARTLRDLMSIAAAMEREAVARYGLLAAEMTRRGDHGLAVAFQAMLEEERDHLDAIERWSRAATGLPPAETALPWQLPPEIARSWDEVAESALLTPYRALSIAVLNEERGFAFYSYLAANAEDGAVQEAAERLAAEELNHAALLRRERRRAYRREQSSAGAPGAQPPTTATDFARRAERVERAAAMVHARIAQRLAALGDKNDAAAFETLAAEERQAAGPVAETEAAPAHTSGEDLSAMSRVELLRSGLAETERLYDFYVDLADHAGEESVLRSAQSGAARAVRHLGLIAARLHAPVIG